MVCPYFLRTPCNAPIFFLDAPASDLRGVFILFFVRRITMADSNKPTGDHVKVSHAEITLGQPSAADQKLEQAKGEAASAAHHAKDAAVLKAGEVSQAAHEKKEAVKAEVQGAVDSAAQKAGELKDAAGQKLHEAAEAGKQTAHGIKEEVKKGAEDLKENVAGAVDKAGQKVAEKVRHGEWRRRWGLSIDWLIDWLNCLIELSDWLIDWLIYVTFFLYDDIFPVHILRLLWWYFIVFFLCRLFAVGRRSQGGFARRQARRWAG